MWFMVRLDFSIYHGKVDLEELGVSKLLVSVDVDLPRV